MNKKTTVLLIGSGRMALHLTEWCKLISTSINLISWNRKEHSIQNLNDSITKAEIIWLALSDDSLKDFYENTLKEARNPNQKIVHFSGAFNHPDMIAAHPLMTFSDTVYSKNDYECIVFALTGTESLKDALPDFQNNFFQLDADKKPLYHAFCVLTGNLPQILWTKSLSIAHELDIPDQAITTYLQKCLNNFLQLKEFSVTGPIKRNDYTTIQKNLEALSEKHSDLATIYKSFLTK